MNKSKIATLIITTIIAVVLIIQSCKKHDLIPSSDNSALYSNLSDYHIFKGNFADLNPNTDYVLYELATPLFTDHAEKQRLIKIPQGTKMQAVDDGLPTFPDGTILVKTFYYYHDLRNTLKGKRIIETRILVKSESKWIVGTYIWNDEQTDAVLVNSRLNKTINWIDDGGHANVISYHIPNVNECATCHNSSNSIIPIGPKLRNLNMDVVRNNITINQLQYLLDSNLISTFNLSSIHALPNWRNMNNTLEERARAYLDVNCAHCHNEKGFASDQNIWLDYDIPLEETRLIQKKSSVVDKISTGEMPKAGTTIIDQEGLALIKAFIDSKK